MPFRQRLMEKTVIDDVAAILGWCCVKGQRYDRVLAQGTEETPVISRREGRDAWVV